MVLALVDRSKMKSTGLDLFGPVFFFVLCRWGWWEEPLLPFPPTPHINLGTCAAVGGVAGAAYYTFARQLYAKVWPGPSKIVYRAF